MQGRKLRQAPVGQPCVVAAPLARATSSAATAVRQVAQRARVLRCSSRTGCGSRCHATESPPRCGAGERHGRSAPANRQARPRVRSLPRHPLQAPRFSRMCARCRTITQAPRGGTPPRTPLIDIGINLAHDSYDADRDAVIDRAAAAGVAQLIVTGSTLASTRAGHRAGRTRIRSVCSPPRACTRTTRASSPPQRLGELRQLAQRARGGRGRRMRPRLLPRLLAARRAAAGLPPPARAGARRSASRYSCTSAMRTRTSPRSCASTPASWRGVAHCFTGNAAQLERLPGARACDRHHRLDLR